MTVSKEHVHPVDRFSGITVLVIGDLILDRFVEGRVRRISPEAPVPVVEVDRERLALGGAANVAHNLAALGGSPLLVGILGDDREGEDFAALVRDSGLDTTGLLRMKGRRTTVKTRIVAHRQQVVRVDREVRSSLDPALEEALRKTVEKMMDGVRAVVASDYAKGLFSPGFLAWLGNTCRNRNLPYIVDPKPLNFPYPGATAATPNRAESSAMYGGPFEPEEAGKAGRAILEKTDWDAVLLTLGDDGMALVRRSGPALAIPADVREVFDVTGAGDTVAAVFSLGLAAGISMEESARLANKAAGIVVGKVGTAVCTPLELKAAMGDPSG
jgi:rfaE bifunctional protein kinase chain/domain